MQTNVVASIERPGAAHSHSGIGLLYRPSSEVHSGSERTIAAAQGIIGARVAAKWLVDALFKYSPDLGFHVFCPPSIRHEAETSLVERPSITVHDLLALDSAFRADLLTSWFEPMENWQAMLRLRSRLSSRLFPITAITHTISYRALAHEWILATLLSDTYGCDSLICSSEAVRRAFVTILEHVKDDLQDRSGGTFRFDARLDTIPLGIDTDYFTPGDKHDARNALGYGDRDVIVLYHGRLSLIDKADLLPLLGIFHNIITDHPSLTIRLLIAGDDTRYHSAIYHRYIKDRGLSDTVAIYTRLSDDARLQLYRSADIFVSPADSIQEAFGLAPLQAMSCGLPVVLSDWNGYRELISNDVEGFLVPTWSACCDEDLDVSSEMMGWERDHLLLAQAVALDVGVFQERLALLCENAPLRAKMGAAARRRACSNFSLATFVQRYQELRRELCGIAEATPFNPRRTHYYQPLYSKAFAHYPSHCMDESTIVSAKALTIPASLKLCLALPPLRGVLTTSLLDRALATINSLQAPTVDGVLAHLRSQFACDDEPNIKRHLLWLLKHGLIEVHDVSRAGFIGRHDEE